MTRHFTRKLALGLLSVVGIVLVFALMMALLPISLPTASADPDPDEVYIPAGWSRVSSDTDFAGAVALGGKRALDRDIKINTTYRLTMAADLQLDINGFSVSHGPNYRFLQIYTNGYDLSLYNSNPGKGTFNATIVVEVGPSDEKSNIVIADDVAVAGITIHRKTAYEGGFCFDQIKLLNGSLRFFQYYEDESVDPNYKAGFYNNETRQNEFKSKFEFGQVGNYYVDGVKVADADAFWDGFEWGDYSCSAKMIAFLKPRAAINTALGAEMIQTPTAEQNGWASVTTAYEDDAYARTQNNNVYAHKWFRSVNGGGYQECNGYNGNYSNDGYELIDKNIELGAKSYTYYAELTDASWLGDIKTNSEKITIYSAPLVPLDVVVDGPHSVNQGTEVILKGHYTVNPYNVDTNIIKYEYKWQRFDSDEGVYYDIAGSGKMTYKVNTATSGRQGFRFCVRAAGKGDQFSEWAPSAYFEVVVGAYDSPVVSLPALEVEGIAGDAATLTATVDNADYFDEIEYQWYYLNPNEIYLKLKESSWGGYTFADMAEDTLSITRTTASDEALIVRCQVTGTKNGYKRTANSADVSVTFINLPVPTITIQPQGATLQRANTTYALAVFATTRKGELSYQWQSSQDGSNWENIQGETAYNYQADRSVTDNAGTYYRCVVSNAAGSTPSEAALIRVKDGTILNATLVQGLEARAVGELLDGGEIDNASRTLICHLGDTILIGFTASNGNASNSESSVGTDWRKVTGLSENGMGEYYVDTSMAGTFEYYGRYLAEYDDGDGIVQSILYDRTNDERMRYKVIVLPNEDDKEYEPISVDLGDSVMIPFEGYGELFANSGSVTTSSHALLYGNNWASSVYRLVRGYRLFVGIPSEEEGVQYVCVAQAGYYYQPEAASYYYEGEPIEFDTSDEALAALGIETLDGAYDAYLVMDY
ncbi:MAG: hypothetical protein J5755_05175, partial [Clostridia bacterium]|nr:hypothetical protein [Clostridia bacterium]